MSNRRSEKIEAWKTILTFLLILSVLSAFSYYAILKLKPTSIYVGSLMLCPALASFITLKIFKRPLASLPWSLKHLKYLKLSYVSPLLYVSIAYVLIWTLGFGGFYNTETVLSWGEELGVDSENGTLVIGVMVFLLLTVGVVKNLGSTLGEEIGWRGFLIFELKKVMSFKALTVVSGIIWAVWHYPIIHLIYGQSDYLLLHIGSFSIMIIGISVVMAYYTFKSNSLWPAAVFHSVHNIFIQKICSPLTITNPDSDFWIDEYGLMIPIVTSIFAIYFWRKATKEGL